MTPKAALMLLLLLPLITACDFFSKKDKNEGITPGTVIDATATIADPSMTYSVYLPKSYSDDKKFPVILAFDPHGEGNLPVAMYRELAEKYGYILIGSDNSRNGLDGNAVLGIINAMLKEVKERYSTDTSRIYTLGFSGGARVAVIAALEPGGILSVTGSGAGFPNAGASSAYNFDYLGMAGTYDFNMHELIILDEYLEKTQMQHALILFNGIHEWPPKDVMERSFLWNDLCAMRKGLMKRSDEEIKYFRSLQDSLLYDLREEKDLIGLRRELQNAVSFLDKLADAGEYKKELSLLDASPEYLKSLEEMKKQQAKELEEQHLLQENYFLKDTIWWGDKLKQWEKIISTGGKEEIVIRRLKSYLSLISYMNYTRAREARDQAAAAQAMWIYEKVDPEHAAQTKNGE